MPSPELWAAGAVSAGGLFAGAAAALFHPRATVFGPCVWRGPEHRPWVALTFDDGPHPHYTPRIAEILDAHRAPATFFCVGARLKAQSALGAALHAAGHQLANHTYAHGTGRDLFSERRLTADLARSEEVLLGITGRRGRFYRPAVGIRNPVVQRAARAVGLTVVTWTHAARDGAFALSARKARALAARAGPGAILALHDGSVRESSPLREATVSHLPVLLAGLRERGLTPVTLETLLS
ncbi:MAG TPA: polysaccharide deacetylase family protein [Myxococcaceae bacterium]|nr:polysaccharide deacetylase family protein [Myxococcaceae bacterium]